MTKNDNIFAEQWHRNVFNAYEGKSVVAERFIRTLKNKIDKNKTSISENCVYWLVTWHC